MAKGHRVAQQKPGVGKVRVVVQVSTAEAGHRQTQADMPLWHSAALRLLVDRDLSGGGQLCLDCLFDHLRTPPRNRHRQAD